MRMHSQQKINKLLVSVRNWGGMCLLVIFAFASPMEKALAVINACTEAPNNILMLQAPDALNVDPSVALGQVIGSTSVTWNTTPVSCSITGIGNVRGVGTPNGNIYPTTIPGVGYRAKVTSVWASQLQGYWPTSTISGTYGSAGNFGGGTILLEFIKTGVIPASGGVFSPGKIGSLYVQGSPLSADYITYNLGGGIIINPVTDACTVTSSAIDVPLEDIHQTALRNQGAIGKSAGFSIPISCKSPVNISISFSGDMANSGLGVFKNTNAANANNVGIQLLDKNNNPVSTVAGQSVNVGLVNGTVSYPMRAQYYALTDNVPEGAVNAIAYASIVYN